ncbi:MAG TPA: acylphosphatase [Candidatus Babeliales bacterium]|nr:acylphosphatase [Candidatus Babeliales bacterium]
MNKCLKITFSGDFPEDFFQNFIQKNAKKLKVEGTVQFIEHNLVKIIACGTKEAVDAFLDVLHKGSGEIFLEDIEIEPFLKEKDYRGVFRVIE